MAAIDPEIVNWVEQLAAETAGVVDVHDTCMRWLGCRLQAELHITVEEDLPTRASHRIAKQMRHTLFHDLPQLSYVDINVH